MVAIYTGGIRFSLPSLHLSQPRCRPAACRPKGKQYHLVVQTFNLPENLLKAEGLPHTLAKTFSLLLLSLPVPSPPSLLSLKPWAGFPCWDTLVGAVATGTDGAYSALRIPTDSVGKLASGWKADYLVCLSCVVGKWDIPIQMIHIQHGADAFNWNNNDNCNEQGCSKMVWHTCSNRSLSPPTRREPCWYNIIHLTTVIPGGVVDDFNFSPVSFSKCLPGVFERQHGLMQDHFSRVGPTGLWSIAEQ